MSCLHFGAYFGLVSCIQQHVLCLLPESCLCNHVSMIETVCAPHQVTRVIEEEWSYIPVGGPLPLGSQTATAFGAAANLVHPATGYSIARSLREASPLARDMAAVLRRQLPVRATAAAVWSSLWPAEKRRQVRGPPILGCSNTRICQNGGEGLDRLIFRCPAS